MYIADRSLCYIAISNIQQPYISVSVSCDTKEHQYTFLTASYSRSHSNTAVNDINKLTKIIWTACSVRIWNCMKIPIRQRR